MLGSHRIRAAAVFVSLNLVSSAALAVNFVEADRLAALEPNPGDGFGTSVAVLGDTAVICAERRSREFFQSGECLVWGRSGDTWAATHLLAPSEPQYGGRFGSSVAFDGARIVVGASAGCCPGTTDAGRAFVFRLSEGDWVEEAVLLPVDGQDDDFFGTAVAIQGDWIVVGAAGDDEVGFLTGTASVFHFDGTAWQRDAILHRPVGGGGSDFGAAVAFDGEEIVVGSAGGGAFRFGRVEGTWQLLQHVAPSLGGQADFGVRLAVSAGRMVIAAPALVGGRLYVYEKQGGSWVFSQELVPVDAAGRLGIEVDFHGFTIVAGADRFDSLAGIDAGAVYVFRESASGWAQTQRLTGSASLAGDHFGQSVGYDGTTLFVGAPDKDIPPFANYGEAYVFDTDATGVPPVADAASNATAECNDPAGALVTLDGFGSTGDIALYEWLEGTTLLGTGPFLQVRLPLGMHTITLRVTTFEDASDTDEVTVTVVDDFPGFLLVDLAPRSLWPPNHRLVDVTANVSSLGVCGPATLTLESVTSSEPDDEPGGNDGTTTGDIDGAAVGTDDRGFRLRAERMKQGGGRIYTATYRGIDGLGREFLGSGFVTVPSNQGGPNDPLLLGVTETPAGTRVDWTEVDAGLIYNVVRGSIAEIHETNQIYDLGAVACIEPASLDTTTAGFEDGAIPAPGEAFFYVVDYADSGEWASYGAESAWKPRVVTSGDCP